MKHHQNAVADHSSSVRSRSAGLPGRLALLQTSCMTSSIAPMSMPRASWLISEIGIARQLAGHTSFCWLPPERFWIRSYYRLPWPETPHQVTRVIGDGGGLHHAAPGKGFCCAAGQRSPSAAGQHDAHLVPVFGIWNRTAADVARRHACDLSPLTDTLPDVTGSGRSAPAPARSGRPHARTDDFAGPDLEGHALDRRQPVSLQ